MLAPNAAPPVMLESTTTSDTHALPVRELGADVLICATSNAGTDAGANAGTEWMRGDIGDDGGAGCEADISIDAVDGGDDSAHQAAAAPAAVESAVVSPYRGGGRGRHRKNPARRRAAKRHAGR